MLQSKCYNIKPLGSFLVTGEYEVDMNTNKFNDSPFMVTGALDNLPHLDRPQLTAQITPRHLVRPVPSRAYHPDQRACLRYPSK